MQLTQIYKHAWAGFCQPRNGVSWSPQIRKDCVLAGITDCIPTDTFPLETVSESPDLYYKLACWPSLIQNLLGSIRRRPSLCCPVCTLWFCLSGFSWCIWSLDNSCILKSICARKSRSVCIRNVHVYVCTHMQSFSGRDKWMQAIFHIRFALFVPVYIYNRTQLFQALSDRNKHPLRSMESGRSWKMKYKGEGGTDAGGLFRDSLREMCCELQSYPCSLKLLLPCPNQRFSTGDNQDKWVPNPACKSQVHMDMYKFIGALMGACVRSNSPLELDLPSLVWKPFVGEVCALSDVVAIDQQFAKDISSVRDSHSEDLWSQKPRSWTVRSVSGKVVSLRPNSAKMAVEYAQRNEYMAACVAWRLSECASQVRVCAYIKSLCMQRAMRAYIKSCVIKSHVCEYTSHHMYVCIHQITCMCAYIRQNVCLTVSGTIITCMRASVRYC